MKLFITIFAAILAAAGVIYGFQRAAQAREKKIAVVSRLIDLTIQNIDFALKRTYIEDTAAEHWKTTFADYAGGADSILKTIKESPKPIPDSWGRINTLVNDYRTVLNFVEINIPDGADWVKNNRPAIDELARYNASLGSD
jgi:hypothetical protein